MTGPDRIEVIGLDHAQILQRLIQAAHCAGQGIRLVAVDAAEGNGRPVQGQDEVFDLDFSKAYLLGNDFLSGINDQSIQNRILSIPEKRPVYLNGDALCGDSVRLVPVPLPARPYGILI